MWPSTCCLCNVTFLKKIYEVSKDNINKSLYYRKKVDTITSYKNRLILLNFSDIAIFKNNQKNYVPFF